MGETIVVGFARTPEGRAAVDAAAVEARRRGGRLIVVRSYRAPERTLDVMADRQVLDETVTRLRAVGITVDVEEFARGNEAADDLIDVVEREDASLVVIGVRRRSPVGKLILGSNAQQVLLNAPCQVLAVKAPKA